MSLHVMSTMGASSVGSLCTGGAAFLFGAPVTLAVFGAVVLLVGLWLLKINPEMMKLARPVFESKGVL